MAAVKALEISDFQSVAVCRLWLKEVFRLPRLTPKLLVSPASDCCTPPKFFVPWLDHCEISEVMPLRLDPNFERNSWMLASAWEGSAAIRIKSSAAVDAAIIYSWGSREPIWISSQLTNECPLPAGTQAAAPPDLPP